MTSVITAVNTAFGPRDQPGTIQNQILRNGDGMLALLDTTTREKLALYVGNGGPWATGMHTLGTNLHTAITEIVATLRSDGEAAGQALDAGLIAGVQAGESGAVAAAVAVAQAMMAGVNNTLGIHSPSRWAAETARNVTETLTDHLHRGKAAVQAAAGALIAPPLAPAFAGAGSGGGPVVLQGDVYVSLDGGRTYERATTVRTTSAALQFDKEARRR